MSSNNNGDGLNSKQFAFDRADLKDIGLLPLVNDLLKGPYLSITDQIGVLIEIGLAADGGMIIIGDGEIFAQLSNTDAKRLIHLLHVLWG